MNSDRRRFLQGAGLAAGALAMGRVPHALAAGGTVVVANWGGDWNDRTVQHIEAPIVEKAGIKIVRDLGQAPERKTKLMAEKNLPRGTIDIAHFADSDAYDLHTQDVLDQLDLKKIPNWAHVHPELKTMPYFVPWLYSATVLCYNPAKIKEPPTSFADMLNPKYAGRVGLNDQHFYWNIFMAALTDGGSKSKLEPGKKKLMDMKKAVSPRVYPTHQQLAAALKTEEVWLCANFKARVLQWQHDGLPVKDSYPKEGAIAALFGAVMPKRARNKDTGYFYLNAMLDPQGMANLSAASFYAPAVDNAPIPGDLKKRIEFTAQEQKKIHFHDFGYVSKNYAAWLEFWNKEFKG